MMRILIGEDHEVTRRGLREILRDRFPDTSIAEAADVASVRALLATGPWDLVLLDIMMPGGNILDTLTAIRGEHPTTPVLVLTALTELEYVVQAMKAGANGLIHKHRASDELLAAIAMVADGGTYLHPETAARIAARMNAPEPEFPHQRLSERELQILLALARGRAVKEIAGDLGISDKTVATYLGRIRDKTGLTSHVEIARYALQHKLVD